MDRTNQNERKSARNESQQKAPTAIHQNLESDTRDRRTVQRRTTGFIYFIRCEGYVKIGYSTKPGNRVLSFVTGNPFPCHPMGMIPGTLKRERELHLAFRKWLHVGEWFTLTPELKEQIAKLCERHENTSFEIPSRQRRSAFTDVSVEDLLPIAIIEPCRRQRPPPQVRALMEQQ